MKNDIDQRSTDKSSKDPGKFVAIKGKIPAKSISGIKYLIFNYLLLYRKYPLSILMVAYCMLLSKGS